MSSPLRTKVIIVRDYAYARQVCAEHYRNVLEAHDYQIIKEKLS